MMQDDLISVVILSWNQKEKTGYCVESVLNQSYKNLDVIVVDNASSDGTVSFLRERFPGIRIIENETNLGFGGGNNVGIGNARGQYIAMLNNDTVLDSRCIEELKKTIETSEDCGAVASKIVLDGDRELIDAAGIVVYPDGLSIGRGRTKASTTLNEEAEVFFASDCACLYRRRMLDDIAINGEIYDEDFFAYADETDLGWRARLKGWKCVYTPKALVHHHHSASTGEYDPFKVFLVERNRIFVAIKDFPLPFLMRALPFTCKRYVYKVWVGLKGKGAVGNFVKTYSKRQLLLILFKVYASTFVNLVKMLKKRVKIQRQRKISYSDIEDIFSRFGISTRDISLTE